MVSTSLKQPIFQARKRKFDHDLTQVRKFSSSVSQLLPVFYDLAYPGDKYDLKVEMFTQLREIVSPAMTHIVEHLDWFFVPLKQICITAPDSIFGIQDYHTTFIQHEASTGGVVIPSFNAVSVAKDISTNVRNKSTYANFNAFAENRSYYPAYLDEFGIPNFYNIVRLSQLLGFGFMFADLSDLSALDGNLLLNPMFACAYQKIFFDKFRIDNRLQNDAQFYNLDKFAVNGFINASSDVYRFFKLHYRPWERDYFTSCIPSPLIDFGSIGMQSRKNTESLTDFQNPLSAAGVDQTLQSIDFNADLASFRGALAVEKLMEITRRADKNYDAQVLAHFGFDVPKGILDHVYKVGSESVVVSINEVVATAAGSVGDVSTTLGEKGGRGSAYASPRKKGIRFTAPCHGILMAIYSAEPVADYTNLRLDKLNTLRTREQFWQPEFDKLGQSPLFFYEFAFNWSFYTGDFYTNPLGWNWRYLESKVKLNDCNGIFVTSDTFKTWTTQRNISDYLADYVSGGLNWTFFYIDPSFIDSIMLLHFHPASSDPNNVNSIFARDPLLHWFKFYVHKSSEISTYSTPNL